MQQKQLLLTIGNLLHPGRIQNQQAGGRVISIHVVELNVVN